MCEVICTCEGNYAAIGEDQEDHHCLPLEGVHKLCFERSDVLRVPPVVLLAA